MYTVYRENGEVKMPFDARVEDVIGGMVSFDGDHYPAKIAEFNSREDGMKFLAKQENKARRVGIFSSGRVWAVEVYFMKSEDGDVDRLYAMIGYLLYRIS